MRITSLLAATAIALAAPALAQDQLVSPTLEQVLAGEHRADDAPRDQYRRPVETLAFFQVEPTMRVVEYGPGGGWYTRVLFPWIAPRGDYMAMNRDSDTINWANRSAQARGLGWTERFVEIVTSASSLTEEDVTAFESDEIPDGVEGTVDRVLVFRSLHGLLNNEVADTELRAMRRLLADDGMVGVVQHRAPEDASWEDANGTRGYLRQSDVIKLFELHGFALVSSSELNANPNDPANWEGGVWTLPPVLTTGEDDPDRERYIAIGESDRMTLLFRKSD